MRTVNDDLLEEMTQRLVNQFQPEQVILFGSHAWGMPDQYSDVDVMAVFPQSDLSDLEMASKSSCFGQTISTKFLKQFQRTRNL